MSRDAGVVRDADGLLRLLAEIDALEAPARPRRRRWSPRGWSPPARWPAPKAAAATSAPTPRQADAAPRRTFVTLADLAGRSAWKHAAE